MSSQYEYNLVMPDEQLPNLRDAKLLCTDVETKPQKGMETVKKAGLHPWRNEMLGLCVGVPGRAWYIPMRHRVAGSERFNHSPKKVLGWLQDTFDARPTRTLVNHNLKFDLKCMATEGVVPPQATVLEDTMVMAHLIEEREWTYALKPLADKWLDMPAVEEKAMKVYLKGQKRDYQNWSVVPADVMAPYGCGDIERPLRLREHCLSIIERDGLGAAWNLERKVTRALFESEMHGFRVDVRKLKLRKRDHLHEAIKVEAELEKIFGASVNPNSPDDLADVVVNHLGLPLLYRTEPSDRHPYGQPKFDDEVLLEYMRMFPEHGRAFWNVRKARRLHHVISFIDSYLFWQVDGIVHANFFSTGARTARMSCREPNLQQVQPAEVWQAMVEGVLETWNAPGGREFFVPRDGHSLLFLDQSQIEYRLFAHYTNSPRIIEAYRNDPDLDYHQWFTDEILKNRIKRRPAKNVNFGIVYGMGKKKLIKGMSTEDAPITEEEGEEILDTYYKEVPELKPLQNGVGQTLRRRGFVKTIIGRRRRISKNPRASKYEKKDKGLLPYQALNAICQGSGAEILKDGYVNSNDWCKETTLANLLIPIHDEVVFDVPTTVEAEIMDVNVELQRVLGDFTLAEIRVPLYVNAKVTSTNWQEAKAL